MPMKEGLCSQGREWVRPQGGWGRRQAVHLSLRSAEQRNSDRLEVGCMISLCFKKMALATAWRPNFSLSGIASPTLCPQLGELIQSRLGVEAPGCPLWGESWESAHILTPEILSRELGICRNFSLEQLRNVQFNELHTPNSTGKSQPCPKKHTRKQIGKPQLDQSMRGPCKFLMN